MIGREAEWDRALQTLQRLDEGPCAVLLEGDPGIGKTTLLDALTAYAEAEGLQLLRCRASQSDVQQAHSGLLQLMDDVTPEFIDELPAPQQRAMRVALRWDEPSGTPFEPQAISAALATTLRRLANEGRVFIALDDLHWLDQSTAGALDHALRRLSGLPVGLVGASRPLENDTMGRLERSLDARRVSRIALRALPATAIRALLAAHLGLELSRRDADRVARHAAGNPFVALEVGRAIQAEGLPAPDTPLPVPDDVQTLALRRFRALPPDTQAALGEAAAMGTPSIPPLDATALAPAEREGLVRTLLDGRVVFDHPLHEAAIYGALPLADRRATHARLAATAADPEQRAMHLALAADGPDEVVAAALTDAAGTALARGALDLAGDLAERAWRSTPVADGAAPIHRALMAARLALAAGRAAEAGEIVTAILPAATGGDRGRALQLAGEAEVWARSLPAAVEHFTAALDHLGDDPAAAATVHLGLAFTYHQVMGDPFHAVEHARAGLAAAERSGPAGPLGEALATNAMVGWLTGQGVDRPALDRAVQVFDEHRLVPAHFRPDGLRATILGYSDELAPAVRWFDDEIARRRTVGASGDMAFLALHASSLAMMHGDRGAMERATQAGREAAADMGGALAGVAGMRLCELALQAYDSDGGDESVRAMRVTAAELAEFCQEAELRYMLHWLAGLMAHVEVAVGSPEGALAWVEPMVAVLETDGIPLEPAVFFVAPSACEALAAIGQHDRARAIVDRYESASTVLGRRWTLGAIRRARAVLLAAEGDMDASAAEARDAVEILSEGDYAIDLGRAYLVLGQIERRRRGRTTARAALNRANRTFTQAECRLWGERARTELARTWTPAAESGLTGSEIQVARLAATGVNNPTIASTLFISRRTVEATLSRVYRKLGVAGRSELAGALAQLDETAGATAE